MTLAAPVAINWMFDFGERTSAELANGAIADTADTGLEAKINTARLQAKDLIDSGSYGTATRWRVLIRADTVSPQGYTVEIRPVTT